MVGKVTISRELAGKVSDYLRELAISAVAARSNHVRVSLDKIRARVFRDARSGWLQILLMIPDAVKVKTESGDVEFRVFISKSSDKLWVHLIRDRALESFNPEEFGLVPMQAYREDVKRRALEKPFLAVWVRRAERELG